jgi:hypothetical protein
VGAWGAGLFDDDVAADVRGEWQAAIGDGLTPAEATARLIGGLGSNFADDVDDGPVFWIALAALQLEEDSLDPQVAVRAAAAIPLNANRWREESDPDSAAERGRLLADLSAKLDAASPR